MTSAVPHYPHSLVCPRTSVKKRGLPLLLSRSRTSARSLFRFRSDLMCALPLPILNPNVCHKLGHGIGCAGEQWEEN